MTIQSTPSPGRVAAAWGLYVAGGVAAIGWKVLRDDARFGAGLISPWVIGVMPNFLPAAVLPALVFVKSRVVPIEEYLGMVMTIFTVLSVYEILQVWIPNRTFDWADIAASAAGACAACLIGWFVFFQWFGERIDHTADKH